MVPCARLTSEASVLVAIPGSMKTGSYIERDTRGVHALDGAGCAHKDIDEAMSVQRDLMKPVVKLVPLGVVKG
jgi:RNA-splicing ligase RtcB